MADPRKTTRKIEVAASMCDEFRKVLKRSPVRTREAEGKLHTALRAGGFRLEGKTLRALQAPYILEPGEVRELTRSVRTISHLLEQVCELALNSVTFMKQVGVSPNIEELALRDPPSRLAIEFARYDFIPGPGGPRLIEFNVDSPAGGVFSNLLDNEFLRLDAAIEAGFKDLVPSAPPVGLFVDALLAAYKESVRATEEKPNVGIVDFRTTATRPEQELIRNELRDRGFTAELIDPRDFDFRKEDKGLYYSDVRYHLILRRALVPELARRRVLVAQFLRGICYGDVVAVNPLRSRLAGNKGVLEILTSSAFERFFTAAENQAKSRLLPWTRTLSERRTDYLGREIDLLDYVSTRPDRFVLKPGGGFGGQDVILGPYCEQTAWLTHLDEALNQGGVVQEFVAVREHEVPLTEGTEIVHVRKYLTLGAFAIRGEYAGCIGRVSEDPVVNVARGGGIIPVLEIGGRSKTGPIEAARPRRRRTTGRAK